jgi:hypothetical protein
MGGYMAEKENALLQETIDDSNIVEQAIAKERAKLKFEKLSEDIHWTNTSLKDYKDMIKMFTTGQHYTSLQRREYELCKDELTHLKRRLMILKRKRQRLRICSGRKI